MENVCFSNRIWFVEIVSLVNANIQLITDFFCHLHNLTLTTSSSFIYSSTNRCLSGIVNKTFIDLLKQLFCSLVQKVGLDGDLLKVCFGWDTRINPRLENNFVDLLVRTDCQHNKVSSFKILSQRMHPNSHVDLVIPQWKKEETSHVL